MAANVESISAKGFGFALHGELQARIAPQLYVGGALLYGSTLNPTLSQGDEVVHTEDVSLDSLALGPSATYYFSGDHGLQVHAFARLFGLKMVMGSGGDAEETETDWGPALSGAR